MTDVFISYSRKDKDFVQVLNQALVKSKYDAWVDWENIPLTADWWAEIQAGIEAADTFLFVITPDSIASKVCGQEIDHAVAHNKRLVPIVRRDGFDMDLVRPALGKTNWLFFKEENDFDAAFQSLVETLNTDLGNVKTHTRLLVKALEWDHKQRRSDLLLRGDEFVISENWLVEAFQQQKEPLPTDLHKDYIQAGREAQEREVKREKRRILVLRSLLAVMSVAFLAATGAGAYAYQLWRSGQIEQIESLAKQSNAEFLAGQNTDALITALEAGHRSEKYPESDRQFVHQVLTQAVDSIREIKSLDHHDGVIRRIAVNSDGTIIATGTNRGEIKLWNQSGKLLHTLAAHEEDIRRLAFSPDGEILASASEDRTAKLWNLQGGLIHTLSGHTDKVWDLRFSSDGQTIVTSSHDGTLKLWNREGKLLKTLDSHEDKVWNLASSPDGTLVASHSDDNTVKLWNFEGELLHTLPHAKAPWYVIFSPDSQLIASGGYDH